MIVSWNSGIPTSSNGGVSLEPAPTTLPTGTPIFDGWALDPLGFAYFTDLGTAAVPSGSVMNKGIAYSNTGILYVTTDTTGPFFTATGGIKVRADGAVLLSSNTTTANAFIAGIGRSITGAWFPGADGVSFSANLQTTLVPLSIGDPTPTFTRATTAYQTDFEGKLNAALSGEARFQGARRVRNLIQDVTFGGINWQAFTGSAPTITSGQSDPTGGTSAYKFSGAAIGASLNYGYNDGATLVVGNVFLGSVWMKGNVAGTVVIYQFDATTGVVSATVNVTTSWKRFSTPLFTAGLTTSRSLVFGAVTSITELSVYGPQRENVTGQTNQNPSEYVSVGVLSAPYQGAGVDGVQYMGTTNGNTVVSNVVVESVGPAINASNAACAGGVLAKVVD